MKIDLVKMDQEERSKGRDFMKRVKERWDRKYPECQQASWQKLRDNAARFKMEHEIMGLILFRQRQDHVLQEIDQINFQRNIFSQADNQELIVNNAEQAENEISGEEFTEENKELKIIFIKQLENLTHHGASNRAPVSCVDQG